jgi:hypothetical protein
MAQLSLAPLARMRSRADCARTGDHRLQLPHQETVVDAWEVLADVGLEDPAVLLASTAEATQIGLGHKQQCRYEDKLE